jgi:hypothetical protein
MAVYSFRGGIMSTGRRAISQTLAAVLPMILPVTQF